MWSYSAPDRRPQPPVSLPLDGDEHVVRRHQQPQGQAAGLRLVTSSPAPRRSDTPGFTDIEETS